MKFIKDWFEYNVIKRLETWCHRYLEKRDWYPETKIEGLGYYQDEDIPEFLKIKIFVEDEYTKNQILKGSRYIHDAGGRYLDANYRAVNLLMHLHHNNEESKLVEVKPEIFK